jgi:hypothetical protein
MLEKSAITALRRGGIAHELPPPNLPNSLRMGAILSVGWLRAESKMRLGGNITSMWQPRDKRYSAATVLR